MRSTGMSNLSGGGPSQEIVQELRRQAELSAKQKLSIERQSEQLALQTKQHESDLETFRQRERELEAQLLLKDRILEENAKDMEALLEEKESVTKERDHAHALERKLMSLLHDPAMHIALDAQEADQLKELTVDEALGLLHRTVTTAARQLEAAESVGTRERERLREENQQVKAEVENIKFLMTEEKQMAIAALKQQLEEAQAHADANEGLREQMAELSRVLEQASDTIAQQNDELTKLKQEAADLAQDRQRLEEEVYAERTSLRELKAEFDTRVQELEDSHSSLKEELESRRDENGELRIALETAKQENEALREQVDLANEEAQQAEAAVLRYQEDLASLAQEKEVVMHAKDTALDGLKEEIELRGKALGEARKQVEHALSEVKTMAANQAQQEAALSRCMGRNEQLLEEVAQLQEENKEQASQIKEKEAALVQSHERLSLLQQDIHNMTVEMESDSDDIEDIHTSTILVHEPQRVPDTAPAQRLSSGVIFDMEQLSQPDVEETKFLVAETRTVGEEMLALLTEHNSRLEEIKAQELELNKLREAIKQRDRAIAEREEALLQVDVQKDELTEARKSLEDALEKNEALQEELVEAHSKLNDLEVLRAKVARYELHAYEQRATKWK
eukprot:scaffold6585_cov403-Prasinococcus_capsulatus_cf.AAC.9